MRCRHSSPPPVPAACRPAAPLGLQAISAVAPFASCCLVSLCGSSEAALIDPLIEMEDAVTLAHALELRHRREGKWREERGLGRHAVHKKMHQQAGPTAAMLPVNIMRECRHTGNWAAPPLCRQ